jgi:uncharacterized Zn finger protein (UPF0148 family)
MVSCPICGRQNNARKPEKMARVDAAQKGSWPEAMPEGAFFWMI